MTTFGIIGEGITDQIVIENILLGYFGDQDEEPTVNYVQPLLDQTGQKSAPEPGGWGLVLRYLEQGEHQRALQFNEYLIVHIDTDVSEAGKVTGCLAAVDHELQKKNRSPLTRGDSKDPRSYRDASRPYADGKKLMKLCDKNPSLRVFVEQLGALRPTPAPEGTPDPAT